MAILYSSPSAVPAICTKFSTSAVPTIWAKCFALTTQKFNKVADRHSLARQVGTALGHPTANRRLFWPNLSPDQVGTALAVRQRRLFRSCRAAATPFLREMIRRCGGDQQPGSQRQKQNARHNKTVPQCRQQQKTDSQHR